MTARTRTRLLGRLADLARGHRSLPDPPDLPGRNWPPAGWVEDERAEDDGSVRAWLGQDLADAQDGPAGPPWNLTIAAAYMPPGPGGLDAYYAAEEILGQQPTFTPFPGDEVDEHSGWYGQTRLNVPAAHRPAPYIPESGAAVSERDPEALAAACPPPVAYPPLSFRDDFRDLPGFRATARKLGHAPAGLVRDGATLPELPHFPPGWVDAALDAWYPDEVAA